MQLDAPVAPETVLGPVGRIIGGLIRAICDVQKEGRTIDLMAAVHLIARSLHFQANT
jgi:hypothetical protein